MFIGQMAENNKYTNLVAILKQKINTNIISHISNLFNKAKIIN